MYTILDAYIIFLYTNNTSMYTQYYIIILISIYISYVYIYILDTCKCTHIYIYVRMLYLYMQTVYIYICTPAFIILYIYMHIYCWIYIHIHIYVFYVTRANRTLAFQTCQNLLHLGFTALGHGCRCDHRSDKLKCPPGIYIYIDMAYTLAMYT